MCYWLQVGGVMRTFFIALVGIKGDWPFVRKAMHLRVGFRSARICHLCPGDVPRHMLGIAPTP